MLEHLGVLASYPVFGAFPGARPPWVVISVILILGVLGVTSSAAGQEVNDLDGALSINGTGKVDAAGAVVASDVPSRAVVAGVPAKPLSHSGE